MIAAPDAKTFDFSHPRLFLEVLHSIKYSESVLVLITADSLAVYSDWEFKKRLFDLLLLLPAVEREMEINTTTSAVMHSFSILCSASEFPALSLTDYV